MKTLGWVIFVLFYSAWVLAEVGDKPSWLGFLSSALGFVPYVGSLLQLPVWIMTTIGIARAFKRGVGFGIGLSFLPIVFFLILAFTSN